VETALAVALGLGLAAACGFRVFVPLLVASAASLSGHLDLAPGFEWIGTWPVLLAFATATALEIGAYYVHWLDNLLDHVASPAAVVAGILVMASVVQDMDPWLRWTLAAIAGGGAAAGVQGLTVATRATSSVVTGGTANPVVATAEAAGSVVLSLLSVILPLLGAVLVVLLLVAAAGFLRRLLRRRRTRVAGDAGTAPPAPS
jgi:hypothetical protein